MAQHIKALGAQTWKPSTGKSRELFSERHTSTQVHTTTHSKPQEHTGGCAYHHTNTLNHRNTGVHTTTQAL